MHHALEGLMGGTASVFGLAVTYPLYQAVVARQSGDVDEGSQIEVLRTIVARYGWVGVYAGFQSAVIATGIQSTVYVSV